MADRSAARKDPEAFLGRLRRPAVIDEVQRAPEMVRYLADVNLELPVVFASSIRLSLRMETLELHPATRAERERRPALPLHMLGRFVPSALPEAEETAPWPRSRSFLQDVPHLVQLEDADRFETFAELLEKRSGSLLHQLELARELDVSHRTIARWLDVLEDCFIILRLDPLEQAFGRRLVRRPKLHCPGVTDCFETAVVTEIYRNARHAGLTPVLRYWRDSNGLEVPLVLENEDGTVMPVSIAEVPNPAQEGRLQRWMDLAGVRQGALVGSSARFLDRRSTRVLRYALRQL